MSHEFRTPLNAIIGYSDLILEDDDQIDRKTLVEDIEKIRSSGEHLLEMVNQVLDLSKVEAGRMELDLNSFSLSKLTQLIKSMSEPLMVVNNNKFHVELASGLDVMRSDKQKIIQVLINLIGNAAKFTENGDVSLRIGKNGSFAVFEIEDTGGIAREITLV